MGVKTAPWAPNLSYFDGWAPQLSARVNHGTPATGVIGHMYVGAFSGGGGGGGKGRSDDEI